MLTIINMLYILLIGIIIHAFIADINSMSCDADESWLEYEDKCLKHYNKRVPWSSAHGSCIILRKALLATVDSPEINMFVHNNLTSEADVWIGLSIPDISKPSWQWSDGGNTSSYDDWNMADINSACAVIRNDNTEGYWYTTPCTDKTSYICEKEISYDNCSDWLSFDTHCYLIITEHADTNMAAARNCWQNDAYLISINSQQEADFIYGKLEKNREYWIGLSPLKWVNDAPYQWNNWGDSGPTHDTVNGCVYMNATSAKWLCGYCGYTPSLMKHRPYICERDINLFTTPNVAVEAETLSYTVLRKSHTTGVDALNKSNTQSSTDNSKQLLLTIILPAVCGGIVVTIISIVAAIVIRGKRRRLKSQDGQQNESGIYYNDNKKTTDSGNGPTIDSKTSAVCDTDRSTYEQLPQGPYVNSGQITTGTYASLQNDQAKALQTSTVGESGGRTYEQLSQGPYVNNGQVTAGTYASLQ